MTDLISRQAALDIVFDFAETPHRMYQQIRELPTIDPVKHGKWIKQNPIVDTEECSECGYNIIDEELETPFCPNCGTLMERSEEC